MSDNDVLSLDSFNHCECHNVILAFLTTLTHCSEGFKSFDTIITKSASSVTDYKFSPF